MTTHCPHEHDIAPWVLGALDDDEGTRFRAHLTSCRVCPSQIAELQGVTDTLALAAPPVAPPPELRDRIMRTVRAEAELLAAAGPEADRPPAPAPERRRRRWSLMLRPPVAVGLTCVLVALGIGAGVLSASEDVREVPAEVALRQSPDASATVLVEEDGDARLRVEGMPAPPPGRVYQVWVQREGEDAPRPTDALFQPRDGSATVQVPGGTEGVAAVLVTHEPDGGSPTPTSVPAIVARLA